MGSIFSYTGEAAKTKEMIEEGRKDITLNTLYSIPEALLESK